MSLSRGGMRRPSSASMAQRDVYANLLRDTRGLRRDQALARESWFATLELEDKEACLFELEMLLKGIVCFGDARNHAGPSRTKDFSAGHDYHPELSVLRDAMERIVELVRHLLGPKDKAYAFARYLESMWPGAEASTRRSAQHELAQDDPESALFLMRNSFSAQIELADGLLRAGPVSTRLFHAVHATLTREIGRNAFFNPLVALEFRPEFDRIHVPSVLGALETVELDAAHRIAALTFLSLFRALRYVGVVQAYAEEGGTTSRRAYVMLAVLKSDMRALSRFLGETAGPTMADALEHEVMSIAARDVRGREAGMLALAAKLTGLRRAMSALVRGVGLETRVAIERVVPAIGEASDTVELEAALSVASAELEASIAHAIVGIVGALVPGATIDPIETRGAARAANEARRLRTAWMLQKVVRAFLSKAETSQSIDVDRWSEVRTFYFVRDFERHFAALGREHLREASYPKLSAFEAALDATRDLHLLDGRAIEALVVECREIDAFIVAHLEQAGPALDKRYAAQSLKTYLGVG